MRSKFCSLIVCVLFNISELPSEAQTRLWTVDDCISYALEKNIQVQQASVTNNINEENLKYSKYARYPSLNGSARQNFDWGNRLNTTTGSTVFTGTNGMNVSVSSGLPVFNGFRITNNVKKSETDYEAGKFNTEVIKQSVSLNVLNAFLQILYAEEQVKNSSNQVTSTAGQLKLAEERMNLGAISNSDYLQVKSQLASENLTLATSESQLAINRVTLMQLMELPETSNFFIDHPNLDSLINQKRSPDPKEVYKISLEIKPEVKNAELNRKSAQLNVELAKADYYPHFSIDAGVSTLFSSSDKTSSFGYQFKNNISPAIGISASIPVFLNRQIRTTVNIAKMNTTNAELAELNIKNQLRKAIEQACLDVISSQIEYEASLQQYQAAKESLDVATEKSFQGLMNSVDYLIQKTSFISAESNLLQSKYRLIFSYKVLDFYTGQPLTFKPSGNIH